MKKALTYGAGLIAIFLLVNNYSGAQGVIDSGSKGGIGLITALQGRAQTGSAGTVRGA